MAVALAADESPAPSATPSVSASPDPSAAPDPSVAPDPSATPDPSVAPEPSLTPEPPASPDPSASATPTPSATPSTSGPATALFPGIWKASGGRNPARGAPQKVSHLPKPPARTGNPHADSKVSAVINNARGRGVAAALKQARADGLAASTTSVRVVVEASDVAAAESAVAAAGATVELTEGKLIQVLATPDQLADLTRARGVSYVRAPLPHQADSIPTDEGIAASNATVLQQAGYNGWGVKVAIIDMGFASLSTAKADGLLPSTGMTTVNYCTGSGESFNYTAHGTAVAEVVHAMAPAAQLYLICIATDVELAKAEKYAVSAGIKIVNHSVAWFVTSRGDGSGGPGTPDAIVADATAHGILWVNAAGNYQQEHWSANYNNYHDDATGDWNLFAPGNELNGFVVSGSGGACLFLKWDAWPTTNQDFDLYIYNDGLQEVAYSTNDQAAGGVAPVEWACVQNNDSAAHWFYAAIQKFSADAGASPRMDMWVVDTPNLEYKTAAGSVTEPASSPNAFAAGAYAWDDPSTIENFSSEGPNIAGVIKPDIAAPDRTSGDIYVSGFAGTSAASPHVAGAAALLKQMNGSWGPAELRALMSADAVDAGPGGPDNAWGAGILHLQRHGDSYFPLVPNRILDTHATSHIGTVIGGSVATLAANTPVEFQVSGQALGDATRNVPAEAKAVTGILSASNLLSLGWLAMSNSSAALTGTSPTSNLNLPAGDARAAGVTVPLTDTGTVFVMLGGASLTNTADVTFDVTGYFLEGTSGSSYHALTPNRVVDSRTTSVTHIGLDSGLTAGTHKSFTVTGLYPSDATRNVPLGSVAVVGNLTVTNQTAPGELMLGPVADDAPTTTTIDFPVQDNRATGVTVKLAADGSLSVVYSSSTPGATADVIFDVTGYFSPDSSGALYVPVTPNRIVDSRVSKGFAGPLYLYKPKTFYAVNRTVSNLSTNIPSSAVAVTGTLTVTRQSAGGWLSLTQNPIGHPTTSTMNFPRGDNRATGITAPLWSAGRLSITYGGSTGLNNCQVVFDVSGYFLR
jgi:hypothetical protein